MNNIINTDGTIDYSKHDILPSRILQRRLEHLSYIYYTYNLENEDREVIDYIRMSDDQLHELKELHRLTDPSVIPVWHAGVILVKESHLQQFLQKYTNAPSYYPVRFLGCTYYCIV